MFFLFVAKSKIGPRPPVSEVFQSHTIRHTQSVGHIGKKWSAPEEAATYTTHNKHKRRNSVSSTGIDVKNQAATGIGSLAIQSWRGQADSWDVNKLTKQEDEKHIIFESGLLQTNGFIVKKKPLFP